MVVSYSEETIFTNEEMAQQFRGDVLRLLEASVQPGSAALEESQAEPAASAFAEDRWTALAQKVPGISRGLGWDPGGASPPGTGGPASDRAPVVTHMRPAERDKWARWAGRVVATATDRHGDRPARPLACRALIAWIMVQLLAHGVWQSGDESWRESLAQLAVHLGPSPAGGDPAPVRRLAASLVAVCMGLLRSGVSMTGGTPQGALAARAWENLKPLVADADPDLVAGLLVSPVHDHAVTLNLSELEDTILLAMDDDPDALLMSELAERGWDLSHDGLMYRVGGTFSNPVKVAADVATRLGRSLGTVLVHAKAGSRWAFIAWRRPDLLLASEPGHAWRLYRIDAAVTPESRFAGAEGIPLAGLVGRPVPFGRGLPPTALDLLSAAGADPADVLTHINSARSSAP